MLVISDSRLVGDMESVAVTDFENGLLRLAYSHARAGAEEAAAAPDDSEAGAVCAFGCLLYEMSTGCQWEHSMAHIETSPASIRPVPAPHNMHVTFVYMGFACKYQWTSCIFQHTCDIYKSNLHILCVSS